MSGKSNIFDRIRISRKEDPSEIKPVPRCEHEGCQLEGEFRAPKGRGAEGQYWQFCLEHVRAYNNTYNYFQGMPDAAIASFQKSALTGHRPTWSMGVKGMHQEGEIPGPAGNMWAETEASLRFSDPFSLFREKQGNPTPKRRPVGNSERKAFMALNLEVTATASEIKLRYKQMVKRFHPDANGGDKAYEDKLRDIIQAYTQLKNNGFC
jgi:hypothetical protein